MGTTNQSPKSFGGFHPLQGEAQAPGTEPRDLGESYPSTFPTPCPALCIPATHVPFYHLVSFLQRVIIIIFLNTFLALAVRLHFLILQGQTQFLWVAVKICNTSAP